MAKNFFEDEEVELASPVRGFFSDIEEKQFFPEEPSQEILPEEKRSIWDKFGEALSFQMKSGGPSGAPSLSPEQAKKVATNVGTQAAVSGLFAPLKYLAALAPYAPRALQFITGLGEAAATGAAIPTTEALIEGTELPSKEELLKEGALWAGIDLALQALHLGGRFGSVVNKLAKENNISRAETVKRLWEGAKNYYGWKEPPLDPKTGAKIILPEQIEILTKAAEKEPQTLMGEVINKEIETISVKEQKIELTPQQIRNRKIAEAERKRAKERTEKELKLQKQRSEKERKAAFRSLGMLDPKETEKAFEETIPPNEDSEALHLDEEDMLSPELKQRAHALEESQLRKDKVSQKLGGIWAKVDVEHPFKKANAPETGRAAKLFYDTKNAYLEEAKGLIKQLQGLNLPKENLWEAFLAAETNSKLVTSELNQAKKLFREYFDTSFQKYKSEGGLSLPWPQSAIERLKQENIDLTSKLDSKTIKKQAAGRVAKEIRENNEAIKELEKLKYIPKSASLITQALADALISVEPKYARRFAISAHRKRKTGALGDWIKYEPRIKDFLHPYDFIRDYSGKKGNDLALLRIIKSAEKEGLASKGEKIGFKMDPIRFPALAGYNVHPTLFEYITNLANPIPFNTYDKMTRFVKGTIVFDPTYALGTLIPYFRTLLQNPNKLAKLPSYWKKALNDLLNATPNYVEFIENGGASNPFPETQDFKTWIEKAKIEKSSPLSFLENFLTKQGLKKLGNDLANFSWMIERLARMAYYNLLRDKGLSARDAAKLSAENFVDYNKLPAKSRRWLGRLFFAPVYQVLSILNDITLASSPFKLAKSFISDKENFKNDRINKERIGLLIGTGLVILGLGAVYKNFGFKEEEPGTRYVRDYEGENGKEKELVITPTHPLNVSLRWLNTFFRGFGAGESSPFQKLWGRLKSQLGPVPSYFLEIMNNKDFEGKEIWDPIGDSELQAMKKISLHALEKMAPFLLTKFWVLKKQTEAKQEMRKIFGWLDYVLDSIEFFYTRKPESARRKSRIRYLRNRLSRLRKEEGFDERAEEKYLELIEELQSKD